MSLFEGFHPGYTKEALADEGWNYIADLPLTRYSKAKNTWRSTIGAAKATALGIKEGGAYSLRAYRKGGYIILAVVPKQIITVKVRPKTGK